MTFAQIFWPAFTALVASGVLLEIGHFMVGVILAKRADKANFQLREKLAKQMGIDPSELEVMGDISSMGMPLSFPLGGDLGSQFATTSGDGDYKGGQYL